MSYYPKGSDGTIWEISPCPYCKGTKEVDNMPCHNCDYGVVGQNVTCDCTPYRMLVPFDKNCPSCWGTGIRGYRSSIPPTIRTDPLWK
jgi:hypothetical protein